MICVLLVAGHGTFLETQIKNDETGLYSLLTGVPKALLPGIGGKKILDFWWETVNMRQLFTEVYLVTNADKYKHYERWATANDFPVENVINDGSTTMEDRLGAVADLELAIRSRKLQDDIIVIAGDMLCADQNFDIAQVVRFFRSKPGELIIYYELEESEKSCSRGIVEVCPDTHKITRFLEKPQEDVTMSRLASVVFYCIQRKTLSYLTDFLSLQPQASDRTFGQFWEWLINEKKLDVFGMKLPTGFQLIGQVGLSDYTKWLTHYSTKKQDSPAKAITCRSYARVGLMGNPSDGFNGKTIALSISNFWAEVSLKESQTLVLVPHPLNDPTEFGSLQDLFCISRKEGYLGGLRLLQATCKKFYQFCSKKGEEDLASLTEYIYWCYNEIVMGKTSTSSWKLEGGLTGSGCYTREKDSTDVLMSIDGRLSSLDARLCLLELVHKEFQALWDSLEFSQQQVKSLAEENASLRDEVISLTEGMTRLSVENKKSKETVLDLQARSMRDNLVFASIPEEEEEDPEATVKSFIKTHLKLPEETVNHISFPRIHRLGGKKKDAHWPRPIVAKFVSFKQKEQVKSQGPELRGKDFSVNDQFPKDILDRHRVLFLVRRKLMAEGCRAVIAGDKLFVNGQLYQDQNATPWLY